MTTNPFDVLGIPPEAAAHLDHNELQVLLALRKKIEDARHRELNRAIESLSDPGELDAWKNRLAESTDAQQAQGLPLDGQLDAEDSVVIPPQPLPYSDRPPTAAEAHLPSTSDRTVFADEPSVTRPAPDSHSADEAWNTSGDNPQDAASTMAVSPAPPSAILPLDTELARYRLVVREALKDNRISTGVSLAWLAKKASELALSRDELEELLATRRDFGAGMPALMRAIMNGIQVPDLYHLYRVRDEAASALEGPAFSIKWINAFCDTFPETNVDDEGLAEILIDVHHEVKARIPWLWKYPDDALQTLIQVSRSYNVNNIDSCLDRLGPRRDDDE